MLEKSKMEDQQSEKEIDSKQAASSSNPVNSFNPAFSNIEDIKTAISLLQSEEEENILLSIIESLSKYASKLKDNLKILFDLDILTNVLPIIKHDNLCIRRFAAKLLAEMIVRPDVRIYLIKSNYVTYFAELLENETDTFMQEYFSVILAKLSANPIGAALLAKHYPNVDLFFEMIKSTDPDITKNNLEILNNLMQDLDGAHNISKIEELCLCLLYQHFESSYPEIQHLALDIVTNIIARNKNENIQSLFRKTKGIERLLDFLKNNEELHLQIKALKILRLATENVITVDEFINIENILQIFNYAKITQNSNFFLEAFRIIVHVANTPNGRQILHSHAIIDEILDQLKQIRQSEIIEVICYGIGKMALYSPAAEIFANKKLIITILNLMKNEDLQWSAKYAVIFALRQLLISDSRNYDIFFQMLGQDYLLLLVNYFPKQVSVEICTMVLEILTIIARHVTFRNILVDFNIVNTIFTLLESTYPFSDELKIICCDLLSILCLEETGKQYFLKANGVQRLYPLITDSHSISIRNAAIQLVEMISIDLTAGKTFVEHQYLLYMLNNRSISRVIPSWETCIKTLFKSYLPMKFALTGRLSENDITQDGFYVLRRSVCPFPILDDIWKLKICPLEPIYVVNCLQLPTLNILKNRIPAETKLEAKFGRLQCDPHFIEYVEQFKCILLTTELKDVCTDVPLVLSRAKALAQFVVRQMCGFYPEIEIDQQLEVHLKEIKEHLETSVIPLGQLRVGSYLERALLFKTIADRVCLPVALVRGEYGTSWVEIAIPQMEDSNESFKTFDDKAIQCSKSACTSVSSKDKLNGSTYNTEREKISLKTKKPKIPIKLIKPKFIIDLMEKPGDLIPIGSYRAKLYCTKKLM